MLGFNFVDVLIILGLLVYILPRIEEGFFVLARRLIALVGAAVMAFLTYGYISNLLSGYVRTPQGILDAGSFIVLFMLINYLLNFGMRTLQNMIPMGIQFSKISRLAAVVPALIDGLILSALVLFLLVIIPILPQVKAPIESSRLGNTLVDTAASWETKLDKVFGKATAETLGFLTVKPQGDEKIDLPYRPSTLTEDRAAEQKMLILINIEREKAGVKPLVFSEEAAVVARAHSRDMWERSYFAHESPEGLTPFDRLKAAGIKYRTAGENLALARNVERAHEGLMNSEGHRRNILDPDFGKVGIGVIDGGLYGQMFSQAFTD